MQKSMTSAWSSTSAASWVRNEGILLIMWRMNLQEQVVTTMLAAKDSWSSSVTVGNRESAEPETRRVEKIEKKIEKIGLEKED